MNISIEPNGRDMSRVGAYWWKDLSGSGQSERGSDIPDRQRGIQAVQAAVNSLRSVNPLNSQLQYLP